MRSHSKIENPFRRLEAFRGNNLRPFERPLPEHGQHSSTLQIFHVAAVSWWQEVGSIFVEELDRHEFRGRGIRMARIPIGFDCGGPVYVPQQIKREKRRLSN